MSRRPLILLVLALAAGLLGYGLTRFVLRSPAAEADATHAQLDWLAREFSLDVATRAEIARLQTAYEPVCETHCAAVARAQAALRAAGPEPAVRAAAETELARLKQVCAEATRAHLREVAALMPPAEAKRFLAMMEPRVAHSDKRAGPPSLAPSDAR
jgi:hypothetical protein